MSILAGATHARIYRLLMGQRLYSEDYTDFSFFRFDASICPNGNMELVDCDARGQLRQD